MLDNNTFKVQDDNVLKAIYKLYENDKIYGAFIFGSRFHKDNRECSDWDIALFTDLDFFEIEDLLDDIRNNINVNLDVSDICDLPINIQYEVITSACNILFLKSLYEKNWIEHIEYLKDEIRFKLDVRGDSYGIYPNL